jgi:hypothetical protein
VTFTKINIYPNLQRRKYIYACRPEVHGGAHLSFHYTISYYSAEHLGLYLQVQEVSLRADLIQARPKID